jgi:small subunit ribosomal protein S1
MSQIENPPVATETAAGEAPDAAVAAEGVPEAGSPVSAESGEPGGEGASAAPETGEAAPVAEGAAAEAAASAGKEKPKRSGKRGRGGAAKKTHARRPPGKPDEVVPPTPEDLAGIHSDLVRAAIEAGHPVLGKVIGWNQGGFHVVVDGVTAFCPKSSMELGPPREPAQYLDQEMPFRVLRVEEKGKRLVLSHAAMLREARKQAAEELKRSLHVGDVVKARVTSLTDFGAFVDMGGVEGMIHVSEIRHVRVAHPKDALAVGQTVDAKILKLAAGGDRISLSMRALEADPWDGVAERHPAGGRFTGKVLRKSEFGWFVELEPGVEGLLHNSQLEPGMKADDARLAAGATLEGFVREVDSKRKRISLSLRETPVGDPWQGVETKYHEGNVVTGKVEKVEKFGVFVQLEPGLTGLLPGSELGLPRGANVGKVYSVGKQVKVQISQVDPRRKRISLTIEGKTLEGSRSDYQTYVKQTRKSTGLGALAAALEKARHTES